MDTIPQRNVSELSSGLLSLRTDCSARLIGQASASDDPTGYVLCRGKLLETQTRTTLRAEGVIPMPRVVIAERVEPRDFPDTLEKTIAWLSAFADGMALEVRPSIRIEYAEGEGAFQI